MAQQRLGIVAILGEGRDANAERDERLLAVEQERTRAGLGDLGGDRFGIVAQTHIAEDDHELIATQPCDRIHLPH